MTLFIGGLGEALEVTCPVCSAQMVHRCIATLGTGNTIRYAYQCDNCELELKSDKTGYCKIATGSAGVTL